MAEFSLDERLDVARRRLIVIEACCTGVTAGIGTSDLIWAELDDVVSAMGDLAREALDALKGTETMPFDVGQWEPAAEETAEGAEPGAGVVASAPEPTGAQQIADALARRSAAPARPRLGPVERTSRGPDALDGMA